MACILIIDDEEPIRETLRKLFEHEKYDVMDAPNGKIAMEMQRENPADLAIVDLFMPEKEGLETIQELKQEFQNVKIIAISGYAGGGIKDLLNSAKAFGAMRTFIKPFSAKEILGAVHELLNE